MEKINGLGVKLVYLCADTPAWEKDKRQIHNHYTLVIKNEQGTATTFDFWGSVHDYETKRTPNVKGALECVLSDALSGFEHDNIDDFAEELGYTNDTKVSETMRIFNLCKEAGEKLKKLGLDLGDINRLSEKVRGFNF